MSYLNLGVVGITEYLFKQSYEKKGNIVQKKVRNGKNRRVSASDYLCKTDYWCFAEYCTPITNISSVCSLLPFH